MDFQGTLRSHSVGGEVRQTRTSTEDHDAVLLHVADCAARNVSLSNLRHGDSRLNAGVNALLLQEVLQSQGVHHGAEHTHVVCTGAVHTRLRKLSATEEVAATNHDGGLNLTNSCGNLLSDAAHDLGRNADFTATENLTGKLEQNAATAGFILVNRVRNSFGHGSSSGLPRDCYGLLRRAPAA